MIGQIDDDLTFAKAERVCGVFCLGHSLDSHARAEDG